MTRKKKALTKRSGPTFTFNGQIAPVSGTWFAIYFEVDKDGAVDETVATLPVACWAACVREEVGAGARGRLVSTPMVGGMVAGMNGLELAEIDGDFRGYISEDDEKASFVDLWEIENGFEEDEEEVDEDEDEEGDEDEE